MENRLDTGTQRNSGVVLGALLVLAGILFLAVQIAPFDIGQYGWPLFVILPGLALIAISLTSRAMSGFAIIGSIVTVVGLILAVQNAFGLWAAWSYAWALVFPGAVGLGVSIMGAVRRDRPGVERGLWMAATGITLCTIFGIFFEGVLHVSGVTFGPVFAVVFPVFLIAFGLALLLASILAHRPKAGA